MNERQIKLVIGSLLHDIGKIVYRSGDGRNHSQSGFEYLEQDFKLCDLLFGYCEKFDHTELRGEIMHRKNRISERMTKILARQALSGKKCSRCGRAMPWNAPYGICERCFKRRRWEGKA